MAQVNAGRVRFVSRGEYNNSTQYYLFDLVDYNGSSYFAKANTTGNVPTNTTYWQLVAEKGNTGGDGPVGPTGNGIASIVKTASAGLIDTYTITFTDGTTSTFEITNGADGGVTQEYVDEHDDQLRTLFNVLPKVSDSGESVTLNNTGDTMLYKMDLKGNTSQEVIQGEVGLEVENTSIYVDDVNEDKENYITLKGNTSQETTSISGGDQYDSPSPDYPQDIEVVTGNNTIKVEGKNLFDNITENKVITSDGTILNNDNWNLGDYIKVQPNTKYTFSRFDGTGQSLIIGEYDTSKTFIQRDVQGVASAITPYTITTTATTEYVRLNYDNTKGNTLLQFEQGTTATTYEAYQGASYPVNLGSIELCKIGTYQDRIYKSNGNWYLHKEIGKAVLNGSENWIYYTSASTSVFYILPEFSGIYYKQEANLSCYCDYYKGKGQVASFDDVYNLGNNVITLRTTFTRLVIRDDRFNNIGDFKAELSTNNTTLYYVLATPTETQITDTTLVNQLNALYNATIYSTTHINTETSNLLPYINLKYNVVTASPSPDRASEVEVVKGNNTITISNEDGTKTQTYNITLGNLELCKIGNYQDYFYKENGNWYLHKEIGKVVLNGSEENLVRNQYRPLYQLPITNIMRLPNASTTGNVMSNNFTATTPNDIWNNDITGITNLDDADIIRMRFQGDVYSTLETFKNWLSTHNTEVRYVLATPTTTQITDQLLVSQLDELQKAMSYYDKTIITQTNADKSFILDVIAIRDLQDIFNL